MTYTKICPCCHSLVESDVYDEFECHKCGCEFTADGEIIVEGSL